MRVYFIGAHSVGKTTLARYVSEQHRLELITEVARAVLAEMEIPLEQLRTDLTLVERYQRRVFERQIRLETKANGSFVSDRAFDNVAYAVEHTLVAGDLLLSDTMREYMKRVAQGVVFFVRPHRELLREDGTREAPQWESVVRIDAMIKLLLEMHRISYFPLHSLSMQERVRAVEAVLNLQLKYEEVSDQLSAGCTSPANLPTSRTPDISHSLSTLGRIELRTPDSAGG